MSFLEKGKKKAAEEAAATPTNFAVVAGLTDEEKAAIAKSQEVSKAETKAKAEAPTGDKKLLILQEVKIDQFCTMRRRVKLTPSMCRHRGCGFDAAKEVGYKSGWDSVPHDQPLPTGKTLGQAILGVLDLHTTTAHTLEQAHIMTEEEVNAQKQWRGVPGPFLTPARA